MAVAVKNLRTEYKINPVGIDTLFPRLSWELVADGRNIVQTAYQIRCANTSRELSDASGLIWDSGKINSDRSIHVEYDGEPLLSGQRIFWQVKIWTNNQEIPEWSETAFWEMGLLNSSDWKAQWIEPDIKEDTSVSPPCPYLRKEFTIRSDVRKATVYATCRGVYELSLNGKRVSDQLFLPGWTSYHHRLQYQVFDVTEMLNTGDNCLGVILGDGWYRGYLGWQGNKNFYGEKLALLIQLKISYSDGSETLICSDMDWKSITGPILKSDIYNGETYDARLEIPDWNRPGPDDKNWYPVKIRDYGYENLIASEGIPVRITEILKPIKKMVTPKGELVFDLGQNMVGWVQIKLPGKAGSRITLHHAETLDQEGNFYTGNIREAKAEDSYFFKGSGIEVYEPHFTFHGFRYVKISGYDGEIPNDAICGKVIHTDMLPSGDFECSDPLINQLQRNIQWSLRGNFLDVPTDCPQRDERLGWTGDAQVFATTACFNRDAACFYRKWMKDFAADQRQDGSIPWVIPNVIKDGGGTGWSDGFGSTGWADAAVIIPWILYQVYSDTRILADQYDSMKAWEEYMIREAGDNLIFGSGFHFGDWLSFADHPRYTYNAPDYGYAGATTEKDLIATACFYHTTSLMHKIAGILDERTDTARYASLLPEIKTAFQREFMTQTGRLTSHTQTAWVLALSFGLLPDERVESATKRLVEDIRHFGHLTTGFLGTPFICQALTDNGYPEIAYKLLFNKKYPSWLYPVTMGATTIWERWDGIKPDGSFQDAGMNSFNHYAYGAVGNWLYSSVAGINPHPDHPGYKRIIIKPYLTDQLRYAAASYHSVYGRIVSRWEQDRKFTLFHLEIPANTMAEIYLPCADPDQVYESDQKIGKIKEFGIRTSEDKITIVETGSGKYKFRFPLNG